MEWVKVYRDGRCCGEGALRSDGERVEVSAGMDDPGDGLYRAVLVGERGELALGLMESEQGALRLRRRPKADEVARVGAVRQIRAECSFTFQKAHGWEKTGTPWTLFRDEFLRRRLRGQTRAWQKRDGALLRVALPLEENRAFALDALFCFARVERVEGVLCAVFSFDGQEMPVHSAKN